MGLPFLSGAADRVMDGSLNKSKISPLPFSVPVLCLATAIKSASGPVQFSSGSPNSLIKRRYSRSGMNWISMGR